MRSPRTWPPLSRAPSSPPAISSMSNRPISRAWPSCRPPTSSAPTWTKSRPRSGRLSPALNLPVGAETQIQRISLDAFPVYSVAVSGADAAALEDFVTTSLAPAIDRLSGGSRNPRRRREQRGSCGDPRSGSDVPGRCHHGSVSCRPRSAESRCRSEVSASSGFQLPARVVAELDGVEGIESLLVPGMVPGTPPVPLSQIADRDPGRGRERLDHQPTRRPAGDVGRGHQGVRARTRSTRSTPCPRPSRRSPCPPGSQSPR